MLDIQGRKYAAVTVCDVTLYDINTKYPVMYFDTLQLTSVEGANEVTEIQGGKGNPILASISHSKNVDVQFDDAIMTMSSLAVLTGGELSSTRDPHNNVTITMAQTEIIEIKKDATEIELAHAPKADTYVYIAEMIDGVLSTVTRTILPVEANKKIALDLFNNYEASKFGDANYRVFYEYEIGLDNDTTNANELSVLADKFAGTYRFIGDTVLFNQYNGNNDVFQIEVPKLKLNGSFSFSFNAATEAAVFSFQGKALRDDLGRMIIFRQIEGGNAGNADENAVNTQLDGSYLEIPAEFVTIENDGTMKKANEDEGTSL